MKADHGDSSETPDAWALAEVLLSLHLQAKKEPIKYLPMMSELIEAPNMRPYVPHATELAEHVATRAVWSSVFEPRSDNKRKKMKSEYQPQITLKKLDQLLDADIESGFANKPDRPEPRREPFAAFLKKQLLSEGYSFGTEGQQYEKSLPNTPFNRGFPQTGSAATPNASGDFFSSRQQANAPKPENSWPNQTQGSRLHNFFAANNKQTDNEQPSLSGPKRGGLPTAEQTGRVIEKYGGFTTARDELVNNLKKQGFQPETADGQAGGWPGAGGSAAGAAVDNQGGGAGYSSDQFFQQVSNAVLGGVAGGPYKGSKKFVPPIASKAGGGPGGGVGQMAPKKGNQGQEEGVEKYPGLDNKLVEMIEREIMQDGSSTVTWDDIAGLDFAKRSINEIILWPLARPDLFKGLRQPPKGLLLFGPPGTGKTMIGRAIASQLKYTFFNMSASSLTSKWVGEGEKLVKTLFQIALIKQPSVIFIDEIDSLLCARSENENESSRRIKTEFLVQIDGAKTTGDEKVLFIGATNRPEELDEAVRRRFVKRLYIPLPDSKARESLIQRGIEQETRTGSTKFALSPADIESIVELTKGYSAADMHNLMVDAAMSPLRDVVISDIQTDELRPVLLQDFVTSLQMVKSTVGLEEVERYRVWNRKFGSSEFKEEI